MRVTKEMIDQIETIHRMKKDELYETYGDMIPEDTSEHLHEVKLDLAYLIYAVLYKEPNEFQRDLIYDRFMHLEMEDELRAYSHSKSTQRIIKRMYRDYV